MKYDKELVENPRYGAKGEPKFFLIVTIKGKVVAKINIFDEKFAFEDFKKNSPIWEPAIDDLINSIFDQFNIKPNKVGTK